MKFIKLGELCNIIIGRTPSRKEPGYWGKGYKWVSISDLKEKTISETKEEITQNAIDNIKCRLIPKGTLLFSFKLTIGKMAFAGCDLYTNEAIAGLLIKNTQKINAQYLYYALKAVKIFGPNQAAKGKTLNSKSLALIKVPIPVDNQGVINIDDQTRIATLLSKVESLIAKRKKSIADLDELLKSTFLEMFGDPTRNENKWNRKSFKEISEKFSDGPFGSNLKTVHYDSIGIRVIRLNNVGVWEFLDTDKAYVNIEHYENVLKKYTCYPGDIIIATMGTPNIRACAVPQNIDKAINKADCVLCRPKQDIVDSCYLLGLLNLPEFLFLAAKLFHGQTRTRISMGQLSKISIPIPPFRLQTQFAAIVKKIECLKQKYKNGLNDLETLYGVLSQKAFKGELDLTRIPVAHDLGVKEGLGLETIVGELTVQGESDKAPETREQVLHRLFNGFISGAKNGALSLDNFWLEAEEKLTDLMDEDEPPLGVADYDRVRDWLFDMLAQGKVAQVFNEQENHMEIRPVP